MKTAEEIYRDVHNRYNVQGGKADKFDLEAMEKYADQFKIKWEQDLLLINDLPMDRIVVCFESGLFLPYYSENWPFLEVVGWILLPEFPTKKAGL